MVSFLTVDKKSDRLLLVDLDGTLIGRDEQVSPRVAQSISIANHFIEISIATGREQADTMRFATELGLTAPQACDNGAMIFDPVDGSSVWSAPLGGDLSTRVISRLRTLQMNHLGTSPSGRAIDLDRSAATLTRICALDLDEAHADALVSSFTNQAGLHVVKAYLPYNNMWAVDFTAFGIDKGFAAIKLAQFAGVPPDKIIAIGDSYNDLPMFKVSGLRVAMADSPVELKALADYVAPSVDEDGLAVAIEEFVLPGLR